MHVIIHLLTARLPQTKEANYGYKYLHCHIARLLHISYQLLCPICQEKRDIDKSIILFEIKHGISDAQTGRILLVILYQTAPGNTCSRLHLHRNHIQTTLNNEHPLLHQDRNKHNAQSCLFQISSAPMSCLLVELPASSMACGLCALSIAPIRE